MKGDKTVTLEIPPELYQALHDEKNERIKAAPSRTMFFRDVINDALLLGLAELKTRRQAAGRPS